MTIRTIHQQSMKGEFAGFASRFVAFAIDLAIVLLLAGIINWVIIAALGLVGINPLAPVDTRASDFNQLVTVISKIVLAVMPFALLVSYWLIFWTVTGQTVGKRIMGVRVVRMDGQRMKTGNSVRRIIMYFVCMIPFFLGFLWILIDDERRGWHDKVANTCVIYAWNAREVEGFMKGSQRRVRLVEERMGAHTATEPTVQAEGQEISSAEM
ncbi:MAG: RDD family protein [Anaerolineae bacterium]|nr:RDD family protein [Anaerolineae bacterium]MCO5190456.1 RDD family protein [Anaerolineae bacterium]MCO5193503.1 RDD family protein [Anaerolineae bacterium]MCO5196974.1 RDD family protein [Anaerolineae bacterium]MCO5204178.1 RDD family protein [Anaerolineae bacterium]